MILYHGTQAADFVPRFGGGRDYHDYGNGFYTTEDLAAAKEWACQSGTAPAFVYVYELDTSGMDILYLDEKNVLAWISVLMTYRRSARIRGAALDRCNKMIERYGVDISSYDLIRGFRANDSYFQFTTDFVTDTITLETLSKSIVAGQLGYQICIKSERAYQRLGQAQDKISLNGDDFAAFHNLYAAKDREARSIAENYTNQRQEGLLLSDILRGAQ